MQKRTMQTLTAIKNDPNTTMTLEFNAPGTWLHMVHPTLGELHFRLSGMDLQREESGGPGPSRA